MNFLKDSKHGHQTDKRAILLYLTEFRYPKDFQNLTIDLKPDHILSQNSSLGFNVQTQIYVIHQVISVQKLSHADSGLQ